LFFFPHICSHLSIDGDSSADMRGNLTVQAATDGSERAMIKGRSVKWEEAAEEIHSIFLL
jgi:hypothetical protein